LNSELAKQIYTVIEPFVNELSATEANRTKYPQLQLASLIGGTALEASDNQIRTNGVNIIIATPGRLKSTYVALIARASMHVSVRMCMCMCMVHS
jgi:superfamily II DNA/RNA helicase